MAIPKIKETTTAREFTPEKSNESQPHKLPFQLGDLDFSQAFEKLKSLLTPGARVQEPTAPNLAPQASTPATDGTDPETTTANSENVTIAFKPSLPIPNNPKDVVTQTLPEAYSQISQYNRDLITYILTEVRTCQDETSGTLPKIDYALTPEFAGDAEIEKAFAQFATQDLPLVSVETLSLQFQAYYAVQNIEILMVTPKEGKPFQVYKYVCRPASSGEFSFGSYGDASRKPDIMHLFHRDELGLTSVSFYYESRDRAVSLSITSYSTDWMAREPARLIVVSAGSTQPAEVIASTPATWESQIIDFDKSSGMPPSSVDSARMFESEPAKAVYSAKFLYFDLFNKITQFPEGQALYAKLGIADTFMDPATNSEFWPAIKFDRFFSNMQPDLAIDPTNPRKITYRQDKKVSGSHYEYTYTQSDPNGTAPAFKVIVDIGKNPQELRVVVQTLSHDGKTVISELGFVSSPQKSPEVSGVIYEIVYPTSTAPAQFYGVIKTGNDDAPEFIHLDGTKNPQETAVTYLNNANQPATNPVTKAQIKTAFALLPKNDVLRSVKVQIPEPPVAVVAEELAEEVKDVPTDVPITAAPRVRKTPAELTTGFAGAVGLGAGVVVGTTSLTNNDLVAVDDTESTGAGFHGDVFARGTYFFTPTLGVSLEGRVGYNGFSTGEGTTIFQSKFLPSSATVYFSGRTASDFHYGVGAGISLYHLLSTKGEIDVNTDITLSNPDMYTQNLWRPQMAAYLGYSRFSVMSTIGLPFDNAATDAPYITGLKTSVYTFALQAEIFKF